MRPIVLKGEIDERLSRWRAFFHRSTSTLVIAPCLWFAISPGFALVWTASRLICALLQGDNGLLAKSNIWLVRFLPMIVMTIIWSTASLALFFSRAEVGPTLGVVLCFCICIGHILFFHNRIRSLLILLAPQVCALTIMGTMTIRRLIGDGYPWQGLYVVAIGLLVANSLIRSSTVLNFAKAIIVKREQAAEAANVAKSTFLASMSHEIRTPLNGILGMAQAMAASDLSGVQRERLSVIRQSGEFLLAILNDILDLSKIEAGKLELELQEFDLANLALGAHAAFNSAAHAKGISFSLDISDSAQGMYLGDPTRLRQILYNLISNAIKFTASGSVRVSATRADGVLTLTVRDTGIGIDRKHARRLFDKFTQADTSTTRRFGGTGLGLSICRDLAGLMQGDICAEGVPGQGASFIVNLPLPWLGRSRTHDATQAANEVEQRSDSFDGPPLRVLAAEDNQVNQLVLKTLLHQLGIDPHVVANGQEAVEAWEEQTWDVILMDVHMPVMDGPTAARTIRMREREGQRPPTPIIALTANVLTHQVAEYRLAGMDSHVAKPIAVADLIDALIAATSQVSAAVA